MPLMLFYRYAKFRLARVWRSSVQGHTDVTFANICASIVPLVSGNVHEYWVRIGCIYVHFQWWQLLALFPSLSTRSNITHSLFHYFPMLRSLEHATLFPSLTQCRPFSSVESSEHSLGSQLRQETDSNAVTTTKYSTATLRQQCIDTGTCRILVVKVQNAQDFFCTINSLCTPDCMKTFCNL